MIEVWLILKHFSLRGALHGSSWSMKGALTTIFSWFIGCGERLRVDYVTDRMLWFFDAESLTRIIYAWRIIPQHKIVPNSIEADYLVFLISCTILNIKLKIHSLSIFQFPQNIRDQFIDSLNIKGFALKRAVLLYYWNTFEMFSSISLLLSILELFYKNLRTFLIRKL